MIIEDDRDIADLLSFNLKAAGFGCRIWQTGCNALSEVRRCRPDLILLDLMLPEVDGIDICKRLKKDPDTASIPVLMVTAKGTEVDRILGFELGADDYVVKPFSPREVVLRVKAVLSRVYGRHEQPVSRIFSVGPVTLDVQKHAVLIDGKGVELTSTEFKLLQALIANPGQVLTRNRLLERVWGYTFEGYSRTVDTHVRRLRKKMDQAAGYIETVRGVGYRFKDVT